jgi:hypothetical protein
MNRIDSWACSINRSKLKPPTLPKKKERAPKRLSLLLGVDVQKRYHRKVSLRQRKEGETFGHPPYAIDTGSSVIVIDSTEEIHLLLRRCTMAADGRVISRIQEALQAPGSVPVSEVRSWLRHPSLDVLAVTTDLILENPQKIEPPLAMREICDAVRDYYKRCLHEDHESEFVPPIHIAGYELVRWFRNLWSDSDIPRDYLVDLKTMLAELYRSSDRESADRLVNAVIEHLFETPEIAEFFGDWRNDSVLSKGFARAMEWAEKSPGKDLGHDR